MPLAIRSFFWIWLILALLVGKLELLARVPPPALQGIIIGLTIALLVANSSITLIRTWIAGLSNRTIVLFHVTRFVGIYFLYLYRRDELPYAFAVPAGIGDILVAIAALVVVMLPLREESRQRLVSIWNAFGLADILLVVFSAARLGRADPGQLHALTHLPLSLLPTLLVPLLIASHLILFLRLRRAAPPAQA